MPKYRYQVVVEPMSAKARESWGPEYRYSYSMRKLYGDIQGRSACAKSKEEIIAVFAEMRKSWEGYDAILGRQGDRVTSSNLLFQSKVAAIVKEELFGQPRLL